MARQIETRSEFEKKVKAGEVILEPPRQPGRDAATGRYVSNKRLPGMLPPFLIGQQVNITFYNDIDVEAFKQEVRAQVTRILNDIRGSGLMRQESNINSSSTNLMHVSKCLPLRGWER